MEAAKTVMSFGRCTRFFTTLFSKGGKMSINSILDSIDGIVWGIPTIVLILATGLIMTISARGIQFTKFGRAFRSIFKENEGKGDFLVLQPSVQHFQQLSVPVISSV